MAVGADGVIGPVLAVEIVVLTPPPTLSGFARPTITTTVGGTVLPNRPIVAGVAVATRFEFAASPPIADALLPVGLTFDPKTGTVSGTPTAPFSGEVTVTAHNSGGTSVPVALAISVLPKRSVAVTAGLLVASVREQREADDSFLQAHLGALESLGGVTTLLDEVNELLSGPESGSTQDVMTAVRAHAGEVDRRNTEVLAEVAKPLEARSGAEVDALVQHREAAVNELLAAIARSTDQLTVIVEHCNQRGIALTATASAMNGDTHSTVRKVAGQSHHRSRPTMADLDIDNMKVVDLRIELESRGLEKNGKKVGK